MNPLLVLLVLSMLDQKRYRKNVMPYFDTFKMEMLLDKLQGTVNALDKVNRLSQIVSEPRMLKSPEGSGSNLPAPIENSGNLGGLGSLGGLGNLSSLAPLLGSLGNLGNLGNLGQLGNLGNPGQLAKSDDLKNLMSNMGPIMSLLTGMQETPQAQEISELQEREQER